MAFVAIHHDLPPEMGCVQIRNQIYQIFLSCCFTLNDINEFLGEMWMLDLNAT